MGGKDFHVLIVGGSIAGLTLAHCFERAEISYTLLEKHKLAPEIGASVGIWPNGARILDQLGMFESLSVTTESLKSVRLCFPDGFTYATDYPVRMAERFGYPSVFTRRSHLLRVLYGGLRDRSPLQASRSLTSLESSPDGMRALTKDGHVYHADLVVGADGVHSVVRSEMWKSQPESKKEEMVADYACVFGISAPVSGLEMGQMVVCSYDHLSLIVIPGTCMQTSWFLIYKLPQRCNYPHIVRPTEDDAIKICEKNRRLPVCNGIFFGDIWDAREVSSISALEECAFETWNDGRVVCIGDSMHKMTPNLGQGANMAIEDAAALANTLRALLDSAPTPSLLQLEDALAGFAQRRQPRVKQVYRKSGLVTRIQARDGRLAAFVGRYILPYCQSLVTAMAWGLITGGDPLEYCDIPNVSESGWRRGGGRGHHRTWLLALTLIVVVSLYCTFCLVSIEI